MKYCIFSDVHGNLHNLEELFSCTAHLRIDKYICLGDVCNYYPDNKGVIEYLIEKDVYCILGNHDEMYLNPGSVSNIRKTAYNFDETLLKSQFCLKFFKSLQRSLVIDDILFCHGSPNDLTNEYIYPDSDLSVYDATTYKYIFFGHTHRQFIKQSGSTLFCNVGSVGTSRDVGFLMGFVTFDDHKKEVLLYRKKVSKRDIFKRYAGKVPKEVIDLLDREEKIESNYILIK